MAGLATPVLVSGQIVWLASYPKSGNTWLRSLITACRQPPGRNLDINALTAQGAASRATLDELLGLDTGDLTRDELRQLLPLAYRRWSAQPADLVFLKTHDAHATGPSGEPIFPSDATRAVVHLVRDPRDVAVSAMHHWGLSLDQTIARLNNPGLWVAEDAGGGPLVPQWLSDWTGHTRSWLGCPLPVLTVRYEDLLADTPRLFRKILDHIGMDVEAARVVDAIEQCRFDRLQAQERDGGFVERRRTATSPFFRTGKAGGWRQVLTEAQNAALVAAHGDLMRQYGYLT